MTYDLPVSGVGCAFCWLSFSRQACTLILSSSSVSNGFVDLLGLCFNCSRGLAATVFGSRLLTPTLMRYRRWQRRTLLAHLSEETFVRPFRRVEAWHLRKTRADSPCNKQFNSIDEENLIASDKNAQPRYDQKQVTHRFCSLLSRKPVRLVESACRAPSSIMRLSLGIHQCVRKCLASRTTPSNKRHNVSSTDSSSSFMPSTTTTTIRSMHASHSTYRIPGSRSRAYCWSANLYTPGPRRTATDGNS